MRNESTVIFPHGFGDCIQAVPSLREYAKKIGSAIEVGVLERLPACCEVFEGLDFVARVFGVDDPWRDFQPRDTIQGYTLGMRVLEAKHGGRLVWTNPPQRATAPGWCKARRIADELGVDWRPENPWPQGGLLDALLTGHARTHGEAGNPPKNVTQEKLEAIARYFVGPDVGVLAIDTGGELCDLSRDLRRASLFVGVDSGPAHLASCVDGLEVVWVFKTTPIQQAIPLWRDVRVVVVGPEQHAIVESWERWKAANASMVQHAVSVAKGDTDA